MNATVILFPNQRETLWHVHLHWLALGYRLSSNKRGRTVLVRAV